MTVVTKGGATFQGTLSYTDSVRRQMLEEIHSKVAALDKRIVTTITPGNRIAYSLGNVFAEVKVLKSRIRMHFGDGIFKDPNKLIFEIPRSHGWGQLKNGVYIDTPDQVGFAVHLIEAACKGASKR